MLRAAWLLILGLLAAAGCGPVDPLRIAVMLPLPPGASQDPDLEWAVETVNAAGGIGSRPLALDYFDTPPELAPTTAARLAAEEGYAAVIGPGSSTTLLAVADEFLRRRKPLVSYTSTAAEVLRAYGKKGVIWRTRESDIAQTEVILRHARATGAARPTLITALDADGESFFSWFGFFARELGYAEEAVHIVPLREPAACESTVDAALATAPDLLVVAAGRAPDRDCLLRRIALTAAAPGPRVLLADLGLDPTELLTLQPLPPRLEGIGGAVPASFESAYRLRNQGRAPRPQSAAAYDAVLLLSYGLAVAGGQSGEALLDGIKAAVAGSAASELGFDEEGVRKTLAALATGQRPQLRGASGPLRFEPELLVDLESSTFAHFDLTAGGLRYDARYSTAQPEFLTSLRTLVTPTLSAMSPDEPASFWEPASDKRDTFALIAVLSSGFANYRHQADALRQYQLLRKSGLDDDHIVLVMADDLASSPRNGQPGVVRNQLRGPDLRSGAQVDYGVALSEDDLSDILTGQESLRTPTVLHTTAGSNLYVYLVGHGGTQGIAINGKTQADGLAGRNALSPDKLRKALCTLRAENRLRRALIFVESCYGGAFGEASYGGIEKGCGSAPASPLSGVLLLSAATSREVSTAGTYDPTVGAWISDEVSERFASLVERGGSGSLSGIFRETYLGVAGSHPTLYNAAAAGPLSSVSVREFFTK